MISYYCNKSFSKNIKSSLTINKKDYTYEYTYHYSYDFLNSKLKSSRNNDSLKSYLKYFKTNYSYHLVDPSPWPFVASVGAFCLTTGFVLYMHKFIGG